jgi:hypothetical protein
LPQQAATARNTGKKRQLLRKLLTSFAFAFILFYRISKTRGGGSKKSIGAHQKKKKKTETRGKGLFPSVFFPSLLPLPRCTILRDFFNRVFDF